MMVDWEREIEAVCIDGRVVPVTLWQGAPDRYAPRTTMECPDPRTTSSDWNEDGSDYCEKSMWKIRNTQTYADVVEELGRDMNAANTILIDRALWKRVEGLVRGCADRWNYIGGIDKMQQEARAIVALLPVVDPDILAVRAVLAGCASSAEDAEDIESGREDGSNRFQDALKGYRDHITRTTTNR